MRHFTGWEILCHRLPKLVKLTVVFIGDECPTGEFPKDFTYKSKDVQQVKWNRWESLILVENDFVENDFVKNDFVKNDFVKK